MKVTQPGSPYLLHEGDSITCGVTHEIQVRGDRSWVKYEVNTKVSTGEDTDTAKTRAIGHVMQASMSAVHATVDTIKGASQ